MIAILYGRELIGNFNTVQEARKARKYLVISKGGKARDYPIVTSLEQALYAKRSYEKQLRISKDK